MTLADLITEMLRHGGAIILRHDHGTTELKGNDFILRESSSWLTIYHESSNTPEERSHLHLRKDSYSYAEIIENPGFTPQMAFWQDKSKSEAVGEAAKPTFAIYFPSFYDWFNGDKTKIAENHQLYQDWINKNPSTYDLV
ncbi:MAG: hypothetical protein MK132_06175 [Lentisphaerales bacterium]|nr:hypothetical protein [Lentisphaerales bacterium]